MMNAVSLITFEWFYSISKASFSQLQGYPKNLNWESFWSGKALDKAALFFFFLEVSAFQGSLVPLSKYFGWKPEEFSQKYTHSVSWEL